MAEYRYYLIPDAMTRAFPEKFEKQTPTEFFDNIADLEKCYHQLREMPYNNERTWNERARFPYAPNRPLRYHMCSLSTSDIVVTTKNGKETAYYVDSIGFKDVSYLLPELHEVEAQHQKEQVQDEPER